MTAQKPMNVKISITLEVNVEGWMMDDGLRNRQG